MPDISDRKTVHSQYHNADTLNIRIAFHQKYSLQKEPYAAWLFRHYAFAPGMRILEIGCGNGSLWQGHLGVLEQVHSLMLTDFSPGMLETAKENLGTHPKITYQTADIQALPFPDSAFDMVIANMMLYHVPDLEKGLSQVRRVLKPGGSFHCATSGETSIVDYITSLWQPEKEKAAHISFTLQNGGVLLARHFAHVERDIRKDGLNVTNLDDLMAYLSSLASMTGLNQGDKISLRKALESHMQNGVLFIPKEYGTFLCR